MKDTVEVIVKYPNGAGASRFEIFNDRTGTAQRGNYRVSVFQTAPEVADGAEQPVCTFPLNNVPRWLGIEFLVSAALEVFVAGTSHVPLRNDTVYGGPAHIEPDVLPPTAEQMADDGRRLIRIGWEELKAAEAAGAARKPLDLGGGAGAAAPASDSNQGGNAP